MKKFIIGLVLVILLLALAVFPSYNGLVSLDEDVNSSWAQVEVAVKRRADLIPNVVNTVKGYASHESETLTKITEARSRVNEAKSPKELAEADDGLTKALGNINVVVEAYPELKANTNFMDLQAQLEGSENRIATARKDYNEVVTKYNKKVKSLPTRIFAGILGFGPREYFEAGEAAQKAPEVNF